MIIRQAGRSSKMEIGEIIGYVATAIAGGGITQIANWRLNKRKAREEVNGDAIENMRKAMQDFYDPLVERQNARIAELEQEVKELREEKREMEREHQAQIAKLQSQIVEITRVLGINANKRIRNEKGQYVKTEQ